MNRLTRPAAFTAFAAILVVAAFMLGHFEAKILQVCGINTVARALGSADAGNPKDFGLLFAVRDMVDENWVTALDKEKQQEMVYGSVRGMLKSLGDQYTRFMDPTAFKNMSIETKGELGGIGIQIGIRNQQLTVIAPIEDTPASKAGLKSGDIIIKINGTSTEDMALDDAVSRIRGDKGTKVTLTLWRPGFDMKNGKDFELVRDKIHLKNVSVSKMLNDDVAYIKFDSFAQTTAKSVREQLLEFKNNKHAKGLILDLRDNPGGLLDAAVDTANLFIDEGPIVHRVGRNKPNETYYAEPGNKVWGLPTVVLVNGGSASASEILSGAMQDDGVATLVGEKTFGKGLVQTVYPLADNSAVLITTDKYLTAKKRDINKLGIMPDIVVKMGLGDSHEGAEMDGEEVAPDRVGKFPVGEKKTKLGDGTVVFDSIPRNDVPFFVFKDKKFIEADDLQKLFGVALEFDKGTNTLNINHDPNALKQTQKDPQLDKALEVIKEKIAAVKK